MSKSLINLSINNECQDVVRAAGWNSSSNSLTSFELMTTNLFFLGVCRVIVNFIRRMLGVFVFKRLAANIIFVGAEAF